MISIRIRAFNKLYIAQFYLQLNPYIHVGRKATASVFFRRETTTIGRTEDAVPREQRNSAQGKGGRVGSCGGTEGKDAAAASP